MTTIATAVTLSNIEARGIFAAQLPGDCQARNLDAAVSHDSETGPIVTWSCDVIEAHTGAIIGAACFDEHWGEIELIWL